MTKISFTAKNTKNAKKWQSDWPAEYTETKIRFPRVLRSKIFEFFAVKSLWSGLAALRSMRSFAAKQLFPVLIFAAGLSQARAQLPVLRIANLFPPGGRIGSTVELTLTGQDLETVTNLHFSNDRIHAAPKRDASTQELVPNQFLVSIASNTLSGIHDVRALGLFGISNPRAFAVSDMPGIVESSTNRNVASAQTVLLNSVVNGRCDTNTRDFFRTVVAKGQTVCVSVQSQAIDSKLEPILVLRDSTGRELKRCRAGAHMEMTADQDTSFIVEIFDVTFRGGEDFFYRLEILSTPVVLSVFPPCATPGARTRFSLLGRNLPGSVPWAGRKQGTPVIEELSVELDVPGIDPASPSLISPAAGSVAEAPLESATLQLPSSAGPSNPFKIVLASAPVVLESNENDSAAQAQQLSPPCEWTGRFYPTGDEDWAWFEAKKGSVYWIEVWSQRLGNPTDPFLLVQRITQDGKGTEKVAETQESNDQETNVGGREFRTTSSDPVLRVEAKEDSRYRIQVRDLFNVSNADPSLTYRVTISKEFPDFTLVATPVAPPPTKPDSREAFQWSNLVRREGTIPINVIALRRHGFAGDIELKVEGLPSGVSSQPAKIEGSKSSTMLLITAATNAASWAGSVHVIGTANLGDRVIQRTAKSASLLWPVADYNNDPVLSRLAEEIVLGVSGSESQPLSVFCATNGVVEAVEGTKVSIPLRVRRASDWASALKLKAIGPSALDSLKELELDGKATNATLEIDLAQQKLPVGTHRFHLQGSTQGKYRNHPETAKEAEDKAKEVEKTATEAAKSAKEARDAVGKVPKENTEEKEKLEKSAQEAEARQKTTEGQREAAKKVAKEASDRAQPRDVTVMVYSEPITVKVTPKPK